MAFQVNLRSKEQIAGDIVRTILANTDLSDVSPGSSLATLVEAIAASDYQISVSALKILENSNLESLSGTALDKKAEAIRLPNTVGGLGRIPASQASGTVRIGSAFEKISSKMYAGRAAPFAGSRRLYLEDASGFASTGQIYIGRGTASRFEGPITYTSLTNNGSFWTMELDTPLTKSHLHSDLVVLAQGGDRTISAGTTVQVPGSSNTPAISFTVNGTTIIPDGESETTVQVTCTQFGEVGNALAGAIKVFASEPFSGATVTNQTSFNNGRSTENDEDLRKRIKNYPATLSRGTRAAILAAIQGIDDPDTGRTITSAIAIEPTEPGDSSKVYIDDGTGLEPTFDEQPYELLLQAASGQETLFKTAQSPITPATIIGAEIGPFVLEQGMSLTVDADGVTETYTVSPNNYSNLTTSTTYEIVRDFNAQSNIVGFRTLNGGQSLAIIDLSGTVEELRVEAGELQQILGFPIATVRPIFVYQDNVLQSFRGATATLSTNPYPWGLVASDLENVPVIVDGVTQTITITNDDFSEFNTNISSATLAQWATVFRRKVAGAQFTVSGNVLVWSTYQSFSPDGTLEIPEVRADDSAAGWVGDSKMWTPASSGGTLSDAGAERDFKFNRFTGEIQFITKPSAGATIEIGSRTTRAQIESNEAPSGLFTLSPLPLTTGNAKMVVGFDGEYATRSSVVVVGATFTPTIPDSAGASNVIRLFANDPGLFGNAQVDDWLYLVKDEEFVPTWGSAIEGLYRLKAVGINGFATDQTYNAITADTLSGSDVVTVTQANHGFQTGARISVTTASAIGGISAGNLSQALVNITVLNSSQYTYVAGAVASSTAQGTLDEIVYDADTWVEFEVSEAQATDWTPLLGLAQSTSINMMQIFRCTSTPQLIDFGNVGAVTVDQMVTIMNDQIASGTVVKRNPQQLVIRSNDFAEGTCAVLALVGNSTNVFSNATSSSIQSHIAFSNTGYSRSGFPVIEQVLSPGASTDGLAARHYLSVDAKFTDVIDTSDNPVIESPSFVTDYPVGFEALWMTGRYAGLTGRVYNNQTSAPFTGLVRGEGAIRPLQTFDTEQTNPDSLDRYANYGLRFTDLSFTSTDRLVVEMDLDPIDRTVAIPMAKRATIQDIDSITGNGRGQVISFRLKDPDDLDPDNFDLPRPFFDSQSVYKDFDFRDFVVLTKSVGLYRDFDTYNSYATGSLTAIASGSPTGILDGDTFTLDDGVNPPVIFEFDSNATVAGSNVAVTFVAGEPAEGALTAIAAGVAGIQDGDTFTLNDGVHAVTVFEFDDDGSFTVGNIQVSFVSAEAATGSLTAIAAEPTTGIAVGDTFTLDDGVNPASIFEFETGGGVAPGNVSVLLPSATATATQVKTAMLSSINGAASLDITAASGPGNQIDLTNDTPGTAGNVAITETMANAVSLFPTGMSGGLDNDSAATIRAAMIAAINGVGGLDITAAPGAGTDIDLTNDTNGTLGNVAITESLVAGTLTPVGMSGGVDETTAATMKTTMLAAINGATLDITAISGPGQLIYLTNDTVGSVGNVSISETLAQGTLTPVGMEGGDDATTNDRTLVLRSTAFGAPARLRLSIRYAVEPDQDEVVITHINSYVDEARTTILATLPSDALIAGSTLNTGTYTVTVIPEGTLYRLIFSAAGLNSGGQYLPGNIFNVGVGTSLSGSYHIVDAGVGYVSVLAPGNGGVTSGTVFSAIQFPLRSFEIVDITWEDLADAINEYLPDNPIATAEALGTDFASNPIKEATYIAYPASTTYTGTSMSAAFSHHSFGCKLSGRAGIFAYDSSVPAVNGIQATVQSLNAIFPTTADAAGTTYAPIDEDVVIVPSNSKSLTGWLNFNAASSLSLLADIEEIRGTARVQISSKEDGSVGAVRVTGVTANTVESFVVGNATTDQNATKLTLLATDAQSLVRGQMVRLDNSTTTEILRPYRLLPTGDSETAYNTTSINTYFRPTNSIKYTRLTANTARLVFYRFGKFTGQSEPLDIGDQITLTDLGDGRVQVTSNGGDLAARVGDMMYVKPGGPFAADAECKTLSASGITATTAPQYLGYPVVHVIDDQNVIVVAPNITTFGATVLTSETDLVFLPTVYNEKNIRTNKQEGAKFDTEINGGEMYILVKPIGGNMVSIWVQNSAGESTDDMLLDEMLVNTDDYVTLGTGFDLANQGTFRLVSHNGRNHMVIYNSGGGKEEIVDTTTLTNGGVGQRKWRVGPLDNPTIRPIRIVDSESVRLNDRLRISTPLTTSQWFPDTMIGSFQVIGMGWVGITQAEGTLTAVAADPTTGIADGDFFVLNDGLTSRTFEFDTTGSVATGRVAVSIGTNATASQVKTAIIAAINSLGSAFFITASSGAGDDIDLLNRRLSLSANQAIAESFSNIGVTLTPVGMAGAVADDGEIQPYIDISLPNAPVEIVDVSGSPVNSFLIAGNDGAIGFIEQSNYFGFRMVGGHGVNAQDTEEADVFLLPKNASGKFSETFGTQVTALYKTGFEERTFQGIDGYKVFSGLVREAHRTIDGLPSNTVLFPGVKAMGTVVEVLPPLIRSITVDLQVRPKDGVTLNSISEVVRSTVASYINRLGVGQPVVLSEIIRIVKSLPGVFSVTILSSLPEALGDRIVVSDIEKPFVLDASTDITIG